MTAIKHIVFDIGRVLLHWDAELIYTDLIPDRSERLAFLDNVCTPDWNLEQDRGRPWGDAEAELIDQHPHQAHLIRAFRSQWHRSIPHAIEGSSEILTTLIEQKVDVTMLTNFNQDTYLEAEEKFPILKRPRGVTVSGRVQLIKPQREIYDLHATEFNLEPSRTIFFDDSAKNIDGAIAAGWHAHLFTDAQQMKKDLQTHGLNV